MLLIPTLSAWLLDGSLLFVLVFRARDDDLVPFLVHFVEVSHHRWLEVGDGPLKNDWIEATN